ncbi:DUF5906 domain-containing protein [Bacillus sp. AFS031507]|uniref:DUF5906 domain-containing protein n=1 Tax=Bacillus sp. AFS031507 TaxID=2033496 RepID=UPI000BFDCF75|nr:DUF5906 domain-containing protein [Bacillus sp. AFS031507]PGY13192.1 DNA primase [Bacillus sp. AFS031507]
MFIEFKEGSKHAQKGADTSPFHEKFNDAGWLLDSYDLVIDIDNKSPEMIEAMIKAFDIKTQIVYTDRGCHLYFNKPQGFKVKKEDVCGLGFKVEYKDSKNTPAGITIKRSGQLRKIENMGDRQILPDFLQPIKNGEDLFGLDESRNNKIYSHKFKIMKLKNYKKVLRFINEHVFAEPLDPEEFETVAREEEISTKDKTEYDVSQELINLNNIVEYSNHIYYYNGDRYETGRLDRLVARELKTQKIAYQNEVIGHIERHVSIVEAPEKGFDISFANGILRHGVKMFLEIESKEFTPYYIDIDYKEDAPPVEAVDDYLDQLTEGDEDYKKLVLEMIAHCLITNSEFKKNLATFSIIIGKGGEGKGTLLEIISRILSKENCSYNSIDQLADPRYAYDLVGKLANLGDDIKDKPITNDEMKMLKNISTCDPVMVRQLNKMAYSTKLTASLIFTSNHMIKSHEKGDSYKRRVTWAPMMNKPKKTDAHLISKVTTPEALEYWVKMIIEAYFRLYDQEGFTVSKKVQDYTAKYHEENNSCEFWIQGKSKEDFIGKRPPECFNEYEVWAIENEGKAQSPRTLKNAIEMIHELKVVQKWNNGKNAKVYAEA